MHRKKQVYASDRAVEVHRQRYEANKRTLQSLVAVSDAGDQLELWEVRERSIANAKIRRGELMVRIRGFEELAIEAQHDCLFVTLTCPSAFHRTHASGEPNDKWEGFAPREGQAWLSRQWARARAKLARCSIIYYGFRIAEPHHDGTPHWHMVLFAKEADISTLRTVLREAWLSEYQHEPGARNHRCEFVRIDPAKGSAAGYIAKYVAKNIDGFAVGKDLEAEKPSKEAAARVAAWACAHGIRQFQQLGGPQVSIWRECRRLSADAVQVGALAEAQSAADAGDWSTFVRALGGIEAGRRGNVQLWKEQTGELSRYDELRAAQIVGLMAVANENSRSQNAESGATVAMLPLRQAAEGMPEEAMLQPMQGKALALTHVRTRSKCWRIQRKAETGKRGFVDSGVATARCSSSSSPLGPVSITVRSRKNMDALQAARERLAARIKDTRIKLVPGLADDLRAILGAFSELETRVSIVAEAIIEMQIASPKIADACKRVEVTRSLKNEVTQL